MTDPRKKDKNEPDFSIGIVCNGCGTRAFMFPKGDEEDTFLCECGRVVTTMLRVVRAGKLPTTNK